jgi:hypothetical protein
MEYFVFALITLSMIHVEFRFDPLLDGQTHQALVSLGMRMLDCLDEPCYPTHHKHAWIVFTGSTLMNLDFIVGSGYIPIIHQIQQRLVQAKTEILQMWELSDSQGKGERSHNGIEKK